MDELLKRAEKVTQMCGACDYGLVEYGCTCRHGEDPRAVIVDLLARLEKLQAVADAAKLAVPGIVEVFPNIRESDPGWFQPGTIELVKAVDELEKEEA